MEFVGPKIKEEINDYLKTRIESLGFSTRVEKALSHSNIRTIGGIIRKNGWSLSELDGIGEKGIEEIKNKLSKSFDVEILEKKYGYELLKFLPKYIEVEGSLPSATYKVKTEEDWEEEYNKKKEEIISIKNRNKEEVDDYLKTRVDFLSISERVKGALFNEGIRTIGGIARKSGQSLLEINGIGLKGLEEIKKELSGVFNIETNGKDFKFIPKYFELTNPRLDELTEEQKEEKRRIEEEYFEKQEEKIFIYETKIFSLEIDPKVESILIKNGILTAGVLLKNTIESFKEKYLLNDEETDSILDIFNYLILKNKQIEERQDELRIKAFELIGYLPNNLDKKRSLIGEGNLNIKPRNLNILNSFREGLTLDQIGKENNITRERARQIIKNTLDKVGLNHEEEKIKIHNKRDKLKPQKIKKEKWWSRDFKECISCKKIEYKHIRYGLCEKCAGHFSGENRENIIIQHNNKCDLCDLSREETKNLYGRDFYISKDMNVFCKKCHLIKTGKSLGDSRKNKWKMFYK